MSGSSQRAHWYRRYLLYAAFPAVALGVRLWLSLGFVPAVVLVGLLLLSPFVTRPLMRRADARRTAASGARLRTHATLFLGDLERYPRFAPPASRRGRRWVRWGVRGILSGSVDVDAAGLRWKAGRLSPNLPDLVVRWSDVLATKTNRSLIGPLNVDVVYSLRTGETLRMSVRDEEDIVEALTTVPLQPPVDGADSGWVGGARVDTDREMKRLPNLDVRARAALVGGWLAAMVVLASRQDAAVNAGHPLVWAHAIWLMVALPVITIGMLLVDAWRACDVSEGAATVGLLLAGLDAVAGHGATAGVEAVTLAAMLVLTRVAIRWRAESARPNAFNDTTRSHVPLVERIPDGDRMMLAVIWLVAVAWEFLGMSTDNDGGNVQTILVLGFFITVPVTLWSLHRASRRAAAWSVAASLCGLGASAFDLGPVPVVGHREVALWVGMVVVSLAFAARWGPRPRSA